MTEQGLMPELFRCVNCGEEIAGKENLFFSQEAHGILDGDCLKKASPGEARTARRISQVALYTMQYIVSSPMTKLYSFTAVSYTHLDVYKRQTYYWYCVKYQIYLS